jgi:hypothetical protein
MSDYEDASQPPAVYPPQGTPIAPADHPATNFPAGSIRMQGIKDEINAFKPLVNSIRNKLGKPSL